MSSLKRKTKDALSMIAKSLGLSIEGTKGDIIKRIEAQTDEDPSTVPTGSKVKKPANWRQLKREKDAESDREKLKNKLEKRGSYLGSPH